MISIIEREIVDKHHWIRREEFLDLLAVSQSLPGILAVNISVSIGDSLRGLKGSVVAALGTILPSFLIILAIAIFLTPDIIKENEVVSAIFKGIRPCVVALIIAPVLTSARSAKIGWRTVWIPVAVALMIYFEPTRYGLSYLADWAAGCGCDVSTAGFTMPPAVTTTALKRKEVSDERVSQADMGLSEDRPVRVRWRIRHAGSYRERGGKPGMDYRTDVYRHRCYITDDPRPDRHQQCHVYRLCGDGRCVGFGGDHSR